MQWTDSKFAKIADLYYDFARLEAAFTNFKDFTIAKPAAIDTSKIAATALNDSEMFIFS